MTTIPLNPRTPPMQLLARFGPEPQAAAAPVSADEAMAYVRGLAGTHYENFSVLSSLVPARLRDDFAAVYAYCRWSDDLADETGSDEAARARSEALLAWWRGELERCFADPAGYGAGAGAHPVFTALAPTVRRHGLPAGPFHHLLDAFVQDQRVTRYETWEQLLGYCRGSADPVGRIVLHLGGYPDTPENAERYAQSDAVCTALQLTNFWQDVRRDLLERDRVYMPTFESGLAAETLRWWAEHGGDDPSARVGFIRALRPLVERTRELFERGSPLPRSLGPTLRPIVWLFAAGGRSVLRAVDRSGCATLWGRPTLGAARKGVLIAQAWALRAVSGARG